jgi:predicted metal-dependent RNase
MFGLFKANKDPNYDFVFHKDRTKKLLEDAQSKFIRADNYLCGTGFGNDSIRLLSAQGVASKAQSVLKEAIYNANEAIKYSKGNQENINQLRDVVNSVLSTDSKVLFVHPTVISNWEESSHRWLTEFNSLTK